jgi:hypothetical protein
MKKIIKKAQPGAALRNLPAGTNPNQLHMKKGGKITKKAQDGDEIKGYRAKMDSIREEQTKFRNRVAGKAGLSPEEAKEKFRYKEQLGAYTDSIRMKATGKTKERLDKEDEKFTRQEQRKAARNDSDPGAGCLRGMGNSTSGCSGSEGANARRLSRERSRKNGGSVKPTMKVTKKVTVKSKKK